jgi:hydroxymethylpyrimidine pyrophosphatase-like HAD family hydrolase
MKFGVLALDYDGTIASDGILDPEVRSAIEEARARGIVCILVTGRTLTDLRGLLGDLSLFDSVVGENGAVVELPALGCSLSLGAPPPAAFLERLHQSGIQFTRGERVVEIDAQAACQVVSIIREMELPLVVLFNRSRMMVLPQTISKAAGLRQALMTLRLSEHNTIAIGDAENDHELLDASEIGLAVGWGNETLKAAADGVLEGQGPPAVARYIREISGQHRMPPTYRRRRRLVLGTGATGASISLAIRGRNVLIAGDSLSGKSWVAGLLCEQLILQHYSVCVIDPEGDYRTLETLPGVVVLEGGNPSRSRDITRALRYPDMSVVLDLSSLRLQEKNDCVRSLLSLLKSVRRETGGPHRIVVDEAHYFLHGAELLDLELAGYTLITYQVSGIHPDILASSQAIIDTRESDPHEVQMLRELHGTDGNEAEWESVLANLAINEAVLLPKADEAGGGFCKFQVAPRMTVHVRHEHKYLDLPLPERKAFVFLQNGINTGRRARTLKEFTVIIATAPRTVLDGHIQNGDFSRWISGVFRDSVLAGQVKNLEEQYCRGRHENFGEAITQVIQERYFQGRSETG